jgi:hypothetical protein
MLGIWNGEGMGRGWKGGGQFMSNLGPRWTGSYHAKEGFQVSKERSNRELARGVKDKGIAP